MKALRRQLPLATFSVASFAPSIASFLVIPILVRALGAGEWSAIAIGQSAGTLAGVFVGLGWQFNGPTVSAQAPDSRLRQLVTDSMIQRCIVAVPATLIACVVCVALVPVGSRTSSVIVCVGTALLGLGLTWLFIGRRMVGSLLFADAVPRTLTTALGGAAAWAGLGANTFAMLTLSGSVISVVASLVVCRRFTGVLVITWAGLVDSARAQVHSSITAITASTYLSLPTLIVAWLAPASVFDYAIADRVMRMVFLGASPAFQWMQAWVAAAGDLARPRIRSALRITSVGVLCALVGLLCLGQWVAGVLSGREADAVLISGVAIAVGLSLFSRCTGMVCLLALGQDRAVAVSAVVGSVIGVPALLIMTPLWGAVGALGAVVFSELVVLVYQGSSLRAALRTSVATTSGSI